MRLFFLIYTLAATALAGIGVTGVLAAGLPGWQPIVVAAVLGAVAALPATWFASRKIARL
ncbi:CTP synthetase [Roseicyclus sp.]|uniref:CTP synthetase n=1 Tax=Roseicyclus sp. TaxID=1914329 RepID=UPI003FA0BA81